jgi:hypothetical protein
MCCEPLLDTKRRSCYIPPTTKTSSTHSEKSSSLAALIVSMFFVMVLGTGMPTAVA